MNSPAQRPALLAGAALLTVLVTTFGGSARLTASTSPIPPGAIVPGDRERMIARQVGGILQDSHYSRVRIDDAMSPRVMDKFLEAMDGQRAYFLAGDIAEFDQWRMRFDDMIRTGDIEPGYAMFARYQQRNRERVQHALALLEKEPDFTVQESYQFDREGAPWPVSKEELDEIWRKRVKNDALSLALAGKTWAETRDTLRTRYERVLKRVDQIKPEEVFETYLNSYARAFDPHSNYFSPRNSEEYKIQMSLNYEGIGASLQLIDDHVTIMNLIEGGPAAVAGTLTVNDRITAVGQGTEGPLTDVVGWRIDDVVQLIRGKGGTTVRLQVLPPGAAPGTAEKIVPLVRGQVTLEAQAAQRELKVIPRDGRDLRVGVINVPGFYSDYDAQRAGNADYRSTTRDVRRLIEELRKEKVDGLVLDLRGNGGGFLPEAQSLTGLFVDRGPVVQVQFAGGQKEVLEDSEQGVAWDGPLVVLIDRFSASASEIFAGAIQDYRRGIVVGQRSFGKGTVQNLLPLSRWSAKPVNGQLTVTIAKFYRVTGESTQHRGVEPDLELASPISLKDVGESSLPDALPWDRIAAAPYAGLTPRPPSIAELATRERARQQQDADYRWLVSDIAALDQQRQQKTISLNLEERRAERTRLEAARLARENERRAARTEPPLAAVTDIDPNKLPDVLLDQAAQVMADIIQGTQAPKAPAKAPAKAQQAKRAG
jgi:carboxyl-terminal processing protease